MSFFDLDPTGTANLMDQARLNPLDPETLKPGWFAGTFKAPVTGLASAVNDAALLLGDAATPVLRSAVRPVDQMFGTNAEEWLQKEQQKAVDNIKHWAPDPRTTGIVGQVVHGLFNVVPEVVAGGPAGPEVAAVLQGYKGVRAGFADGLDPGTALSKGAIDGISTWVGLKIPMTLAPQLGAASNVGLAAAANVGTGMATRGATAELLRSRGYGDMADQYKVLDSESIAVDLLMGGGFGALAHYGPGVVSKYGEWKAKDGNKIQPSDIDAALTMNNQLHMALDTAPGIPADPVARAAHADAINKAIQDLLADRPVEVPPGVADANFIENPSATAARNGVMAAVEEHLGADWVQLKSELESRNLPGDTTLYQVTRTAPDQMAPVRPTAEVTGILNKARTEGWDAERILTELDTLKGKLEDRNAARADAAGGDRVRGELWVRERLLRAERSGEITPEGRRLAEWLLDKNPSLASDLGISFKQAGSGVAGEAGGYNPIQRIFTIIKGRANDETAAHEILHHAERMMPEDVQAGINAAWRAELKATRDWAARTQNETMMRAVSDAIKGAMGDIQAFGRLAEMISTGEVDQRFYALANPSEFWAVNGSRILRERASESWVKRAQQWLKEFVAKVKDAFGLRSDAAVIRGLDNVLKSDGQFQSPDMLSGRRIAALDVKTDVFKRWFGGSKVVDADGKPLVVYHGTNQERLKVFGGRRGVAGHFAFERDFAEGFADAAVADNGAGTPTIYSAYLKAENIFDARNPEHRNAIGLKYREGTSFAYDDLERNIDRMKRAGFDSFLDFEYVSALTSDAEPTGIAVFKPEQIKSATDNNGQYDPTNPNIYMQVTRAKPGVEAPGVGVAQENLNGFEPDLRVMVPIGKMQLPPKPLVLTGTNKKNAAKQIAGIDEVLTKFPDADKSPLEWSKMMAYAMATPDVPIPPYRFLSDINSDGAFKSLSRLSKGQIEDANHGFENAKLFREAYTSGELDVETTGKLFMWSFLSRGVSPYTQEGLFIDAFPGIDKWIKKAAAGELTEADFPAYEEWAKSVAPKGSGQPGSGATHNLNAFGKLFLYKMGAKDADGVSLLQKMHDMMTDPAMTGQDLRRWFIQNTEGVGIDNKVVSFTLLVAGFDDVMVLDRVQIRQLWDDGRFNGRNLYDGRKVDGQPVAGSMLSEITYGARGLLIYEAIERALSKRLENLYTSLGRPQDASVGRYHWETWVADSQQEASHGTLDAILADAKGNKDALATITAKEGEYGGYAYGARYGRDAQGQPYFLYSTPMGNEYRFSVGGFRQFMEAVKSPSNKVVPSKFKVTEAGNAPWYERAEVNRQALDDLAKQYAGEPGASEGAGAVRADGQGQAVPNSTGRPADPYSAESLVIQRPNLTYIQPDGTMVSASRALVDADGEIARAQQDSQGYDAAVACALRG